MRWRSSHGLLFGDGAFHLASGLDVGKVMEIENVSIESLELSEGFSVFRLISMARQSLVVYFRPTA